MHIVLEYAVAGVGRSTEVVLEPRLERRPEPQQPTQAPPIATPPIEPEAPKVGPKPPKPSTWPPEERRNPVEEEMRRRENRRLMPLDGNREDVNQRPHWARRPGDPLPD